MISLFLRGFLAFGATAVAHFFFVNDNDDVNDDGHPLFFRYNGITG